MPDTPLFIKECGGNVQGSNTHQITACMLAFAILDERSYNTGVTIWICQEKRAGYQHQRSIICSRTEPQDLPSMGLYSTHWPALYFGMIKRCVEWSKMRSKEDRRWWGMGRRRITSVEMQLFINCIGHCAYWCDFVWCHSGMFKELAQRRRIQSTTPPSVPRVVFNYIIPFLSMAFVDIYVLGAMHECPRQYGSTKD